MVNSMFNVNILLSESPMKTFHCFMCKIALKIGNGSCCSHHANQIYWQLG